MKTPSCDSSTYKGFKVAKADIKAYAIKIAFTELELDKWADLDALIMNDTTSFSADRSIKKYTDSFEKINRYLNRYPFVKSYANQVKAYLKSDEIYKLYMEKFKDHLTKKAKRRSKRRLNNQIQLNSEAEVLLEQKKKMRRLEEIDNKPESRVVDNSLVSSITAPPSQKSSDETTESQQADKSCDELDEFGFVQRNECKY